jgi:hypothetical protein
MQVQGGIFACVSPIGDWKSDSVRNLVASLRLQLKSDKLIPAEGPPEVLLMHANEPGVPFRRTDVLLRIQGGFDLWNS